MAEVVKNMKLFDGQMILQTMFLRGECEGRTVDNTTEREVAAWLKLVEEIRPRQVMVYSLDRDTPCKTLQKVPREDLQAIAARVEALGIPARWRNAKKSDGGISGPFGEFVDRTLFIVCII